MAFDQQICRGDNSIINNDGISLSNWNEKMEEEEEEENELITSNISSIDDVWFDSNVVKSINEEVNSVIESIRINEDHVVLRRSFFNAKDFHRLCDNKGPTITVIRTDQGKLFGGYTRISWHSDKSHFISDPNAFLFSFSSNSSIKYSLIDRKSKYAVWNAPNYGPTFGGGADLFVCSQCNIIEESYSKLPSSYRDPTGLANKALAGQQIFFIQDIEIYH